MTQHPAYRSLGQPPPLGQLGIGYQGAACAVAQIGHRAVKGALHLVIPIDRRDPQIQQNVHFGTFLRAHQLYGGGDGQEKEAGFFLTWAVVVQHGVVAVPIYDFVLYKVPPPQQRVLDEVAVLKGVQHLQRPAAGAQPQGGSEFSNPADPLAGINGVSQAVEAQVRGAEIGVGAEDGKTKKTGAPACADAPVCDQGLEKLPVDAAAWVGYELLDFKLVVWHIICPFLIIMTCATLNNALDDATPSKAKVRKIIQLG